jgi:uncharacterized protein (DUF1697 family)
VTSVALLRGINVGGQNKVEMSRLKAAIERLGASKVRTYINSGNVIYADPEPSVGEIEDALEEEFGWRIKVLVRDRRAMESTAQAIPETWVTDSTMRCDVLFLSDDLNMPEVIDGLPAKAGIDNLLYVNGAIIWQVDTADLNRSGRTKIIGGHLYRQSTVRNANTVRKLVELMRDPG